MSRLGLELCSVKLETEDQRGHATLLWARVTKFYYAAYHGKQVIAKSKTWEICYGEWGHGPKSDAEFEQRENHLKEAGYQDILSKLMADGWEPFGADNDGRLVTFRR